jgi:hypothetical protein
MIEFVTVVIVPLSYSAFSVDQLVLLPKKGIYIYKC